MVDDEDNTVDQLVPSSNSTDIITGTKATTATISSTSIDDDDVIGPPPNTIEEVLACQISSWYPTFSNIQSSSSSSSSKRRTRVTFQTKIIDLSESGTSSSSKFREYLLSDGLMLPKGSKTSSPFLHDDNDNDDVWSSDDHDDDENNNDKDNKKNKNNQDNEEEEDNKNIFSFPELDQQIEVAIAELGGYVVPKLNWSSPKDAVWVNNGLGGGFGTDGTTNSGGGLKCSTPCDIYLLLKSSDFCLYDIQHALTDSVEQHEKQQQQQDTNTGYNFTLQLALRKWCNLYPSQEFRCFVKNNQLIAISQRHHSQHYPHLKHDSHLFQSLITEFYRDVIRNNFAQGHGIHNYVFDCYVDQKHRVWIVDFNVWGRRTDTLLFDWSELLNIDTGDIGNGIDDDTTQTLPIIRVVETEKQVRADPLASYRAPIDCLHVASSLANTTGNTGDNRFEEFMKLCERPSVLDAEDGDDGDSDNEN